jgi:hypothetical protein
MKILMHSSKTSTVYPSVLYRRLRDYDRAKYNKRMVMHPAFYYLIKILFIVTKYYTCMFVYMRCGIF